MKWLWVALLLVGIGLMGIETADPAAPATTPAACSDATVLSTQLDTITGHVQLPPNTCYWITDRFWLHGTHNLSVDANGDTFYQVTPSTDTGLHPLVYLTQNRDLELDHMVVSGLFDGTNGGPAREGSYGVLAEANHGLTIRDSTFSNIQGDFVNLQSPNDVPGTSDLNTSVMVTGDTFTNAGYHGITIEAADGATFSKNTFTSMGPDAIDLEADVYSSNIAVGEGRYRAENNIDIRQNTFTGFKADWFANIQPQAPGIQEQHVHLSDNTIDNASPLAEVVGPPLDQTTQPYFLFGLTITGNKGLRGATSTHGGSITVPFVGSAMTIANVAALTISNNTLPLFDGMAGYFPDHPYLAVAQINGAYGVNVSHNTFSGALGALHPSSDDNAFTNTCGNRFGINAGLVDAGC